MKVAIIGGGVSGLSTLWSLHNFSSHEPHLYESGPYIGGHTNTVTYTPPPAASASASSGKPLKPTPVDTGFIVFNTVTYPNFLRFVQYVGAEIIESDMSFSVSRWGIPRLPGRLTPFASLFPTILYTDEDKAAVAANGNGHGSPKKSKSQTNGTRPSPPPSPSRQTLSRPGERGNKAVRGWFEWAGGSPAALWCQGTNIVNPSHWRMVWDIIRFNNQSLETLRRAEGRGEGEEGTIGEWLDERGYGVAFRRNYLIPMTASIWSTPPSLAFSSFPALTLLRFMHNHHLLQILDRPQWLTLKNGSRSYVEKILADVPKEQLHHGADGAGKVTRVSRSGSQWTVRSADGKEEVYDQVVFACHADTALSLLDEVLPPGDKRRAALSQFEFSDNEAVLHADERLMPVRKSAWSAWNFIAEQQPQAATASKVNGNGHGHGLTAANTATPSSSPQDADRVALTYWMNLLQSLPSPTHGPVLVTLNPPISPHAAPRPELIAARYSYTHPVYTSRSVAAQKALKPLQGEGGLHFAGAWLNYGFHEDGFSSGLHVAERLGARLPFDVRSAERAVPRRDAALVVVAAIETVRRHLVSPIMGTVLLPIVVWGTILLEMAANVAFFLVMRASGKRSSGQRCAIRNELRRVRVDWEEGWTKGQEGGGLWAKGVGKGN